MSAAPNRPITPEEYLRLDRAAEVRCDYYCGEMFAMAGASKNHNRIVRNLLVALQNHFRQSAKSCEAFAMDMRVAVDPRSFYTFLDLVVVCGEAKFLDKNEDALLNPLIVVEVLSDSTEAYDRGKKFAKYRKLPTVQEYVLISQKQPLVEQFSRRANGSWNFTIPEQLQDKLTLSSVDFTISLQELYYTVEFPPPEPLPPDTGIIQMPS